MLALASLAPSRVPVGGAALAVRLAGSGFVAGCAVELDDAVLPARFISASELEIAFA